MSDVRRLAAIMFTDMVEFTSATHRNESIALDLLREQEGLVRPVLRAHRGREVKSTGDGFLVELPSALAAVQCAIEIQQRLHDRNSASDVRPVRLRIGVHVGDVEARGDDIFGDAVNIAARVLSIAEPEGIALTEQVAHHLEHKIAFPVESLGARSVKGVDQPLPVYRVVLPWSAPVSIAPERKSPRVAVLPLRNISPDPKDEYFADGLTEELTSVLGQVRELRVIARSSVSRFRTSDRPLPEIGRELGATAVLEGSVRKSGDRLRISLHLVDVTSEEGLWTQTFDRKLDDIFAVQSEVSEKTANALRIRMLGAGAAATRAPPTTNLAAYGLYLQALHTVRRGDENVIRTAVDLYRQAIDLDPNFAAAYAQLAQIMIGSVGVWSGTREAAEKARPLLEKAVELDPDSPLVHSARGNFAMQLERDWAIAEAEFRAALAVNPSEDEARRWYALLLRALQRYSESEEQCRILLELNPLDSAACSLLTSILRLSGRFDEAKRVTRTLGRSLLTPGMFQLTLAYTCLYEGDLEGAHREIEQSTSTFDPNELQDRALLRARLGDPAEAKTLLEKLEADSKKNYVSTLLLAMLAAVTGERDRAFDYLTRDFDDGAGSLWIYYQGIGFDPIRSDPRFIRMLEMSNLPTSAPFYRGARIS